MRKLRVPVLIAWVFCALITVVSIYYLVIDMAGFDFTGRPLILAFTIVEGLLPVMFAIPGALIISHQQRSVIGWLLITPVLIAVIELLIDNYLLTFPSQPPATVPLLILMLINSGAWVWSIFPLLLIPLLFPTGRPPSRSWNRVLYLAAGMVVFFYFIAAFSVEYETESVSWVLKNPIGFIDMAVWAVIMPFWSVLLATLAVSSLASVIFRYRKGSVVEREQIKWLLFAFSLFTIAFIPLVIFNENTAFSMSDFANFLFIVSIAVVPIAITMAILRFHLFDIDVIIRLTLVYAVVTALLAGIYIAGIVAMQAGFRALTGQTSDVAVLVTTLAITSLFNPVRRRVQSVIDRRFYRQKYDAVQALAEFATAARGGSDLDALTGMLVQTVAKTLQPTQVGLYMKPSAGKEEIGVESGKA